MKRGQVGRLLLVVIKKGFEFIEGDRKKLAKLVGGKDTRIEPALAQDAEVSGATVVLCVSNRFEIRPVIIGRYTVQMVNMGFVRGDRPDESHIDEMGDEVVFPGVLLR